MATINASTSGVGGVITTADATGVLDLQTADVTRASVSSSGLKISRVDSSNEGGQLDLCRSSDNTSAWAIDVFGNTSTPSLRFVDNVAASARMAIDGSGNVGIGTSSNASSSKLDARGRIRCGSGTTNGDAELVWSNDSSVTNAWNMSVRTDVGGSNNDLKLLRFNSSGSYQGIAMQITQASGAVYFGGSSASDGIALIQKGGAGGGSIQQFFKPNSGATNVILNYYGTSTYVGGMNMDNTSTSFITSSDARLKKDIVESELASEKIDNIRVVSHGWKHDDSVVDYGLIAQELYEIMPRAVTKGDDNEEVETVWSVDYSKLVPMLIKAHQEQQAIINDLKARIETLEGASA